MAEVLGNHVDHVVGVKVARETNGHIVGHVPLCMVFPHIGNRRIFQIILGAENGLGAVWVVRKEGGEHTFHELATIVGERHVLLLVDGFQLGVEAADDGIFEAVGLNAGPVLDLVGGNVFYVASHVVGGVSVGAVGADGCHKFIILVGNGDERGFITDGVDLAVDFAASHRVGGDAVHFKELLDLVEQRLFGGIVGGTKLLGTLEHKVLEVVSQAGGFSRVVFTTYAHGDIGLDARFLVVFSHEHLQTVGKGVDFGLQRVALNGTILVARG